MESAPLGQLVKSLTNLHHAQHQAHDFTGPMIPGLEDGDFFFSPYILFIPLSLDSAVGGGSCCCQCGGEVWAALLALWGA